MPLWILRRNFKTNCQSYNHELQRQRCKKLQRHEYFFYLNVYALAYHYTSVVVVSRIGSWSHPTTAIYHASTVKIYNAKSSQVRFENKNIFFYVCTLKNAIACYNAGVVVVNLKVVRLAPEVVGLAPEVVGLAP
jgi:hypothetical protein